ncbi:hypothetical protein SSIG_07793 [Streptomyces filamentosus NRRL 11379]|uniref:Predicted protein n=1 Tax=Streptomyces filamentosus NRRL 15998 TaxID=457431 RepID=D6AMR3_STRFL|nr:predicted protein [Streptomyces filamentosus NRRL 15998]EWS89742.1 hypothetical protein SSIG_07833 [Streptomyces filamentosus NRRL 11379]EWS96360.1 hypothetical protein SSIG_07793 [Streptomyces filamentosus NRRL 11379]
MTGRSAPPPEWTELAGRITAFLPELPAREAARIVAGMTPAARTRIRDHLRLHPDALVSGASDAPRSTQALITFLAGAGITGVKAPSCLRCGRVRPLRRAVPGGRVCLGCEGVLAARGNTGPCCVCGEPRPSNQRCASCQRAHISATRSCSTCGKPAALDPCTSCRPRPPARCALCETNAPVCARWPLGPVCKPCYREARIHPGTCPVCQNERVLIAFTDGRRRVCGPCTGHGDPYACPRCASPRSYTVRGLCDRCTLQDELDTVLGPAAEAPDGQYARMRTALAECDQPRTALNWIRNSYSGRLLAGLVGEFPPRSVTGSPAPGPARIRGRNHGGELRRGHSPREGTWRSSSAARSRPRSMLRCRVWAGRQDASTGLSSIRTRTRPGCCWRRA